jgi:hypothetical protein
MKGTEMTPKKNIKNIIVLACKYLVSHYTLICCQEGNES